MLAHARVLGHVFNPLTVYWCHGPDGSLRQVVAEVHNTYGERHCYLLPPETARGDRGARGDLDVAPVPKEFYVSPSSRWRAPTACNCPSRANTSP